MRTKVAVLASETLRVRDGMKEKSQEMQTGRQLWENLIETRNRKKKIKVWI